MVNYEQPGDFVEFTAPSGGVVSGTPKMIGQILVIPTVTAAQGARFNGAIVGVYKVTKVGSQAWAEGAVVFWNGTAFTTAGAGNFQAGIATRAVGAGAGETTGYVRLDGIGREQGT
jgi:predicted RecA/RadA family phage recombinase